MVGMSIIEGGKGSYDQICVTIYSFIHNDHLFSAKFIIDDIEKMINAFWWGGRSNNRGIKWMACPKEFGGMGFRNFCLNLNP